MVEFARENRQLIAGDHQNTNKLLEESDPATTRWSTMKGNHQNIDRFLTVETNVDGIQDDLNTISVVVNNVKTKLDSLLQQST